MRSPKTLNSQTDLEAPKHTLHDHVYESSPVNVSDFYILHSNDLEDSIHQ